MPKDRKPSRPKADRDARAERARQLRERIGGGAPARPKSPRELTDEAAMREFRDEEAPPCPPDPEQP